MKTYADLVAEQAKHITELLPWDLETRMESDKPLILLDVREPYEFNAMHIQGSINVPRGILESACEYDYEETVPELVDAKATDLVVICRSGYRSVLAAYTMKLMGYENPMSLKTGLKGWNDYEQPMVDGQGNSVDIDAAEESFYAELPLEKQAPERRAKL